MDSLSESLNLKTYWLCIIRKKSSLEFLNCISQVQGSSLLWRYLQLLLGSFRNLRASPDRVMKWGSRREKNYCSDTCTGASGHRCNGHWMITLMMLDDEKVDESRAKTHQLFHPPPPRRLTSEIYSTRANRIAAKLLIVMTQKKPRPGAAPDGSKYVNNDVRSCQQLSWSPIRMCIQFPSMKLGTVFRCQIHLMDMRENIVPFVTVYHRREQHFCLSTLGPLYRRDKWWWGDTKNALHLLQQTKSTRNRMWCVMVDDFYMESGADAYRTKTGSMV